MLKNTMAQKGNSSTNTNAMAADPTTKTVSQKSKIKHDVTNTRGGGGKYLSVNKNIEEIAKKISDHGESIYINWKNKGLAPTEILNIANDQVDFLKETLKLPLTNYEHHNNNHNSHHQFSELDMLVDESKHQNIECLVKSFVVENSRKSQSPIKNILTSGVIDAALQKFEENKCGVSVELTQLNDQSEIVKNDTQKLSDDNEKKSSTSTTTKNSEVCKCRKENVKSRKKKDQSTKTNGAESNHSSSLTSLLLTTEPPPEPSSNSPPPNVSTEVMMPSTIAPSSPSSAKNFPNSIKTKMKKGAPGENDNNGNGNNGNGEGSAAEDTKSSNKKPIKPNFKKNSNSITCNPVRPFLTRGSVAERVMMFEKCPDVKNPLLRPINRSAKFDSVPPPIVTSILSTPPLPPVLSSNSEPEATTTLKMVRKGPRKTYIPRFFFPHGRPQQTIAIEKVLRGIKSAFDPFPNNTVTKESLHIILKSCGLPVYWRLPILLCTQTGTTGNVERQRFLEFWNKMSVYCHDTASRFVYILSKGQRHRPYILPEDFIPLVQDVVDTHPGLAFLHDATEFHSRYVHTVIARIYYSVNRSWSGKITVAEIRKSDLLNCLQLLEQEEDINQIMAYFSYEHFYVIYCKFWELDKDHDLQIDQYDLQRHSDHALSTRIIERIFSGCVTRHDPSLLRNDRMSYTDFVWFLLSEEDKTTPTAIEYWFRCMDLDGDGVISMYELEYFYEEQQQRMEAIGIETLPYEDCLCQMLDLVKPKIPGQVTLGDLKRCSRLTPIFFDTFFNLEKYLDHEQRDPFSSHRDTEFGTDWERYAAQEYELLVAEDTDHRH